MTETQTLLQRLVREMRREMQLFDEFAAGENHLNDLAKKKRWSEMQLLLETLGGLAEKIEKCEERRHLAYSSCRSRMNLEETDGFRAFLAQVPEHQKQEFEELHREIKKKLLTIKSLSSGLIYYFACMQESIAQVLNEIFPHRKGKLYSPQGESRESKEEAVVVNHEL